MLEQQLSVKPRAGAGAEEEGKEGLSHFNHCLAKK